MWCVAELNEAYITKMEDVLKTYEKPYDPQQPVLCLDEKPVTLHADVRPVSPAVPGREARRDNEYERRGTANAFCAVEPKAGRHFTFPTPDRSAFEFAQVVFELALQYPQAETIHLVMGQLEYPQPEVIDRSLRRGVRRRNLGPLHRSPHTDPRKLVESGRNRNRNVFQAMPGAQKNTGPGNSVSREPRLESPNEPRRD
jgi:hypothetical protein